MTEQQKVKNTDLEAFETAQPLDETDQEEDLSFPKANIRFGLGLAIFGFLIFLIGARPSLFGLDRSRVIGFVQISVFLIGLGLMSFGSYMTLNAFWANDKKTIAAQIGARLISTGYVICVFTGMADIFGLGSHPLPNVFFGPLQAQGMSIGMVTIAVGLILLIRFRRTKDTSGKKSGTKEDLDQVNKRKQDYQKGSDTINAVETLG